MILQQELLGYKDIINLIEEYNMEIYIFKGLIKELKRLNRPYPVHQKELHNIIKQRNELRLTLLN